MTLIPGGGAAVNRQGVPLTKGFLSFQGQNPKTGHRESFDVLCGSSPPTITGGYANWSTVERPLQRALSIFTGYDPITMTCDVIFGFWLGQDGTPHGWHQGDTAAQRVEAQIASMEWMAGGGGQGGFTVGASPWVYVASWLGPNVPSGFIQAKYRGMPWVVSGLEWGQSWRNAHGYRIYQEATVTLMNYLNLTAAAQPVTQDGGTWFKSAPGLDTALTIAGSPGVNSPTTDVQSVARSIQKANQNNPCKGTSIKLQRRSISWQIKHGTRVYVPAHTIN